MVIIWVNIKGYLSPLKFFKICATVERKNYKFSVELSMYINETYDNYNVKVVGEGNKIYFFLRLLYYT